MTRVETSETEMTLIQPTRGWMGINIPELWRYRELFYFLVWRDIKVRYKQSILGAAWAIIQPVLTVAIFTVFFGKWAGIPTDDIPQPIFYFSAILPWQLLQSGVSKAGASLVTSRNLVTKVYFPRLVVPMAPIIASVLDFGIGFLVLAVLMIFYGIAPTSLLFVMPFFLLLTIITASGVGFWLAGLNVNYRDVGYIIPFLMQVWFFISPIVYSTSIVPEGIRQIYQLNPMTGAIQGFRWVITGTGQPSNETLITSVVIALLLFVTGIYYFRRMERTFADVV